VNITAGNPYFNPHVNRPYDTGPYIPPEHPLDGVARLLGMACGIRRAVPGMLVVASGLTWLREYGANAAAGGVREGRFDFAGFGRQAFAYPGFAADILESGGMDRGKCCIACGKCSEIMRFDGRAGCVVRDADTYLPIYREASAGKPPLSGKHGAEHV
ncbi:MAG: flavin oxidoreductase/NADH oxidase, partial [Candidatus Latescibacteria bacterium]|nr:flavin oxidoreductase/NADH oxidase [Candidatus Latescibacterota bacterium]